MGPGLEDGDRGAGGIGAWRGAAGTIGRGERIEGPGGPSARRRDRSPGRGRGVREAAPGAFAGRRGIGVDPREGVGVEASQRVAAADGAEPADVEALVLRFDAVRGAIARGSRSRPIAKPARTWRCSSRTASSWDWHSQTLRIVACFMRSDRRIVRLRPRARAKSLLSGTKRAPRAERHAALRARPRSAPRALAVVEQLADEVVVARLRDPHAAHLAGRGLAAGEVHLAVDVRRLPGVAAHASRYSCSSLGPSTSTSSSRPTSARFFSRAILRWSAMSLR